MATSSAGREGAAEAFKTINVAEFIVDWADRVGDLDPTPVSHERFIDYASEKIGITREMCTELDVVCNLSALDCDGEPKGTLDMPRKSIQDKNWKDIPEDLSSLITVNLQRDELKRKRKDKQYRDKHVKMLKYRENILEAPWIHEIKHRLHKDEDLPVPKDALVTVQVYDPLGKTGTMRWMVEIQALGQQPLTMIKDNISCRLDGMITGEMSEEIDLPRDTTAKETYPSGFFFIDGVFYNDLRHPDSRDNSLVIREWAEKDPRRGMGPYTSAKMQDTTLDMMSFKLGFPYVYVHQGNCEHLIVFSDIRLVHPEDCLKTEEYPITVIKYTPKSTRCCICLKNNAVWMLRGSNMSPEDPSYFCDTCYRMFHYTKDGDKIGDFRAYHCKGVS